ncbi:DUF2478 domain-containing protein [Magnetospirillum sp. 15-1]|uniref:DUF2478 domain-containing protein n=1 Tax=Magnetospirillum sp. 15-1 TaxID=1979370 RepID=UPI000BBBCFBB|nr:DUF2478 domain-containing protein [Magnetospirillum sp. 15-1]
MTFDGSAIMVADPPIAVAAVCYPRGQGINDMVTAFARNLARSGVRVGGLVQRRAAADRRCAGDIFLADLGTGADFRVSQDLGRESEGCRIDPAAIAEASGVLRRAMAEAVDLLIVNKFGKLEGQGGGLAHEMVTAAAAGIPILTTIREDRLDRWNDLMGDTASILGPAPEEMAEWWRRVQAGRAMERCGVPPQVPSGLGVERTGQ